MAEAPLYLTDESINAFYQFKLDSGVNPSAVVKYKNSINHLVKWLGEDRELTALRLQEWRRFLEDSGYSKNTVQGYVKRINDYLRINERRDLCIPKPLRNDVRNQTFGYLTAIEPTEKRNRKDIIWRWRCRCGREVEYPAAWILSGHNLSCGHCSRSDNMRFRLRVAEDTSINKALAEDSISTRNASGYTCVYKKRDKWTAIVIYKKNRYNLGVYDRVEDAAKARAIAKERIVADGQRMEQEYGHLFLQKPLLPRPEPRREAEPQESVMIAATRTDNTSGQRGVCRHRDKWYAKINHKGVRYHLGTFDTLEEAIAIRQQAEEYVRSGDMDALAALSKGNS